ncbi:ABC transporter ATP-binding protein [Candidatus Saccharibacteria bacterium]|nr:ABC transporter ATP-binding protein [Candidatus Saccharibacteria bacterium]
MKTNTAKKPKATIGMTKQTASFYWQSMRKYKLALFFNIFSSIIAVILGFVVFRYYLALLFEALASFESGGSTAEIVRLLYISIAIVVAEALLWRVVALLMTYRINRTFRDIERRVFSRLLGHSYRFYADNFAGSIVTQFNRFLRAYHQLENILVFDVMNAFFLVASSIVLMAFLQPILSVVMLIWTVIFLSSMVFLAVKKSPYTRKESAADSLVTASVADAITNVLNIKTFARKELEKQRFFDVTEHRFEARKKSWMLNVHIGTFRWVMVLILIISYLVLSVHLVINDLASISTVLTSQLLMIAIYRALFNLNKTIEQIEQNISEAAEMTELLHREYEVKDPENPKKLVVNDGSIEFRDVSFKYADASDDVFSSLNLKIKPGEKVGLVGHSGGGKSTLTRLILRFVDINNGQILIDGQDIKQTTQHELRSQIAYVPQEPILFHRTLAENINYGRIDATDKDIKEAAKLAQASQFIEDFPAGYDTLVGERGIKLSGGEKQRVAIARAMLSTAPILLLDEATSALDSKSEKLISKALDELMKNRTTIVIAHRLSTIKKLDRIIVMKDGQIVEDGNHEALVKNGSHYAELWNHQSGDFLED